MQRSFIMVVKTAQTITNINFKNLTSVYCGKKERGSCDSVGLNKMENYTKGRNVEEQLDRNKLPFQDLPENFLWMQVKGGSKMPNLLSHALGLLEDQAVKVMVWTGAGVAIAKAISCAEIVKRQSGIQNQVTRLTYKTDEEFWEPKLDGLETLVVKRQIPVIHIMLSIDELADKNQLGYQTIESKKFWHVGNIDNKQRPDHLRKSKKFHRIKKNKNL